MKTILVTGGAGYIGSHTLVELLENDYHVIVVDNFSNSSMGALENVKKITNKDFEFIEGDLCDKELVDYIFKRFKIDSVMHFAGLKAVGESVEKPIQYYENNLISTLNLLNAMKAYNVKEFIFSSSATVYGKPERLPLDESCRLHTENPYGTTKLMIEMILEDLYKSDSSYRIIILRYFNPIGAHNSGLIGENPKDIPNNLLPYVARVATGQLKELSVYGNDYDTKDGTGARDYIHVVDLAKGHLAALKHIDQMSFEVFNLGTGESHTVLEIVAAFKEASGKDIPYKIVRRRAGDVASCYADVTKAYQKLNWKTFYTIDRMCQDAWHFQSNLSERESK